MLLVIKFLNTTVARVMSLNKYPPKIIISLVIERETPKVVYESQFLILELSRRGPFSNPSKCIGKKVKFTPKNKQKIALFLRILFSFTPVISGNQSCTPQRIPKTFPILKT
jgi:hypothetical protein